MPTSDSAKTPPAIALMWSVPDEPALPESLRQQYGDYRICPLRYSAYEAARRVVPADNILPLDELVQGGEMPGLARQATAMMNHVTESALRTPTLRWLAAMDTIMLRQFLFFVLFWSAVMQALRRRFPDSVVLWYGPVSMKAPGFDASVPSISVSRMVYRWYAGHRDRSANGLRQCLSRAQEMVGALVNRFPRVFMKRVTESPPFPPAEVLLFGLPPGDFMVQQELAVRLATRLPGRVRWLTAADAHFRFQEDEQLSEQELAAVAGATDRLEVNPREPLRLYAWRSPFFDACSKAAARKALADCLAAQQIVALDADLLRRVARLYLPIPSDLCLQYQSLASVLDASNPRLLITNSAVELGAMAAVWATDRKRRLIRLPHGVEFTYGDIIRWLGDRVAVFGNDQVSALQQAGSTRGEVKALGGFHFPGQWKRAGAKARPRTPESKHRVCLLMKKLAYGRNYGYAWNFLDDMLSLGRVLTDVGVTLGVRAHRGPLERDGYSILERRAREMALKLELTDPHVSLIEELRNADAAIVSDWGGAGVLALLDETPIIGWLPRPGNPESDAVIHRLPLCSETSENVPALLARLNNDSAFRDEVLIGQRALLAELIDRPDEDPYARALDLIEQEHARV